MKTKLLNIQTELKSPKSQINKFGNYSYRSCEDILEAVKPLLRKNDCCLTITDEIVEIGGRVYVKSTAIISDNCLESDKKENISVSAFAREPEIQKGQSESQITGSTSSYARKYALNGLFLIDDTKDDDFNNTGNKPDEKQKGNLKFALDAIEKATTKEGLEKIISLSEKMLWTEDENRRMNMACTEKRGMLK